MEILMMEYLESKTAFQVGSHYYAREFIKDGNSVTWVNQPKLLFSNKDKDNDNMNTGIDKLNEIYPKVILPMCKYPLLNTEYWAKNYLNFSVPNITNTLNKKEYDIMWLTNIKMFELTRKIKYGKLVHRMADDFSGFSGAYKAMLNLEKKTLQESDLVIVTAKNLISKVKDVNKNILYVPNGVNLDRFTNDDLEPEEYKKIDMPKIVYVGAIEDWFDYNLIMNASKKLKEYAFILIGSDNEKVRNIFKDNKNVHILGRKPHSQIPAYLKYADVGVMPFVDNKLTNSIHPLKLYEYFAAGIPVVCRRLTEVENMNSPALLYKTDHEFIELLKEGIKNKKDKRMYIEYAEKNTWNNRYQMILEYLNR